MKFLQSLIKESPAPIIEEPLTEEEQRITPEQVYGKIGDFSLLVKWLEVDNFEETSSDTDGEATYYTYSGTINNVVVAVRRGNDEYFVEVYPADPIESDNTNPAWLQSADVNVFTSVPGGNFPRAAVDKTDPELDAMIDKLVRGFLANNWKQVLENSFTRETPHERRRGMRPTRNDDLADY